MLTNSNVLNLFVKNYSQNKYFFSLNFLIAQGKYFSNKRYEVTLLYLSILLN